MEPREQNHPAEQHAPGIGAARQRWPAPPGFLPDAILGGVYGGVTASAAVAGALGAGLSNVVAMTLGLAGVAANGFNMAIGAWRTASARSRRAEEQPVEERDPSKMPRPPLAAAGATFLGFAGIGLLILLPFLFTPIDMDAQFAISIALAGIMFYGIGLAKGWILGRSLLVSALDTLLTGAAAAALAYVVGYGVRLLIGA